MFAFFSCNTKMIQQEKTTIPNNYTEVKVIDATQGGCDFLLQIVNSDKILNPKDLDNKYKRNDLTLFITYRAIKPLVKKCKKGMPITIEDVILP